MERHGQYSSGGMKILEKHHSKSKLNKFMKTNMKNDIRNTLSRLAGTWRTAWVCLAVVPFRARRRRVLPALIAVLLFAQTTMATTITITSTADSGAGTLRDADDVPAANAPRA